MRLRRLRRPGWAACRTIASSAGMHPCATKRTWSPEPAVIPRAFCFLEGCECVKMEETAPQFMRSYRFITALIVVLLSGMRAFGASPSADVEHLHVQLVLPASTLHRVETAQAG